MPVRRKGTEKAPLRYQARGVKTINRDTLERRKKEILFNAPDTAQRKREEFCFNYLDPKSPTFANIRSSAIDAGYSPQTAHDMATRPNRYAWIKSAVGLIDMEPEHIIQKFQDLALNGDSQKIQLKALEMLGKAKGMFIERKQVLHANIDEALRDFNEDEMPPGGNDGQEIIEASDISVS